MDFYDSIGKKFPREYGEWNEQNYAEGWLKDPSKSRKVLMNVLMNLGEKVDPNYIIEGDLLILVADTNIDTFKGINVESIKEDLLKTFPTMIDYLTSIFDGKELIAFPAIYLGRGNMLVVFNKGVKVVPLKFFRKFLVEARRLESKTVE